MNRPYLRSTIVSVIGLAALLTGSIGLAQNLQFDSWKAKAISPVSNPLFFESPLIQSEVRPLFIHHNIDDDFVGGSARVYALQLRYAVTDRLAVIATKDGFIELNPDVPTLRADGWADIGAGLKYALIDNDEAQFILTPGFKFELPTGNTRVFQGNGSGELNLFVSSMKGWKNLHITGTVGGRIPIDFDEETASIHYSLQLDYFLCRWFIPFVAADGMTVVSEGNGPAFGIEGFDLINFGTSNAGGRTQVTLGAGFRSRLCDNVDLGFAYSRGITSPQGIFEDRFVVDLIYRF